MTNNQQPVQITEHSYQITVKQNRVKKNQVTALHLMIGFLLFMMGLVTWLVPASVKTEQFAFLDIAGIFYSVFGLGLLIISVLLNRKIIQNSSNNLALRIIEIIVLLSILVYTLFQKWYLPFGYSTAALLVIIFAYFWEKNALRKRIISISNQGILIPGFFKTLSLQWQDIAQIVLRHAVLSVDCHGNRFYQFDVSKVAPDDGTPKLFHEFCMEMVERHKELPKSDC